MTTRRLLWGMTWRGAVWGLLHGILLGVVYGASLIVICFLFGVTKEMGLYLRPLDQVYDPGRQITFAALYGAVLGILFGAPIGLVIGTSKGLLLGVLTRAFFFPLQDVQSYRRHIVLVSTIYTTILVWIYFILLTLRFARYSILKDAILVGVLIPALIAGVSAGRLSRRITHWYEKQNPQPRNLKP